MRAGGAQQAQLAERGLARADENEDACRGVEKERKETHGVDPANPLTSIIFYIIVHMMQ